MGFVKELTTKFYRYEAIGVEGSIKEVADELNKVNVDKDKQLVFVVMTGLPNDKVSCIIQTKIEVRR